MVEDDGYEGILCIIDSDFQPAGYQSENLIETEYRDMDVIVFGSSALDNYLLERADKAKLLSFESDNNADIRTIIFDKAYPIGCLRTLSSNINLRLHFKDMPFDFIDEDDLSIDKDAFVSAVVNRSRGAQDLDDIKMRHGIIERQKHPPEKICCGHDIMTILGIALVRCIGDVRNKRTDRADSRTWRSEIEMGCRLAFGRDEFERTALQVSIINWEQQSEGQYRVLSTA